MDKKWLIVLLIFIFAFILRLWNINQIGRTWDEHLYVEEGHEMINLLLKRDFNNSYFYTTYDHPPLVKYFYGITAYLNKDSYDYTFSRVLSAIISSLSIVLTVLIGWHFVSRFVGIASGIILSMLPFFLGLSQLVTAESFIMLSFTSSVYAYILLLKNYSIKKVIWVGVLTGIALQVKQSNLLLIPIFFLIYLAWYFKQKDKNIFINSRFISIFYISILSSIFFIIFWPQLILNFGEVYAIHKDLWHVTFSPKIWQFTLSPPELFMGRLMLTPVFYYHVYFFITIPLLILCLFFVGLKKVYEVWKKGDWVLMGFFIWFLFPFVMSFYSWRQHGLRYIIEIYAPLSIISAIGFDYIASKFFKKELGKVIFFIPVVIYLFFILQKIAPYYLDYFNFVVGGTKNVYEKNMFQLGWWGQGIREAGIYIENNAKKGSTVGLALSPSHVFPPIKDFKASLYEDDRIYDYVVVNYYNIIREGFDEKKIKEKYKPIYFVKAQEAILVTVYKRK